MAASASTSFSCPVCGEVHTASGGQAVCPAGGVTVRLENAVTVVADPAAPGSDASPSGVVPGGLRDVDRPSVLHRLAASLRDADGGSPGLGVAAGKYRSEAVLAAGGMGEIRLAVDNDLNRQVAMKTILPELRGERRFVARFIREAQTVGQLEHPNIVPLYDVGMRADGELYFTMKYVRGRTLKDVIEDLVRGDAEAHRTFTWIRRAGIIQQICNAVGFAHERGIVHRDLKPANIMLGEFGEVIVMDWGLAKRVDEPSDAVSGEGRDVELSQWSGDVTSAGTVMGTPAYMAPEQATGAQTLGPAVDIYAIGAIMYRLFALREVHTERSVADLLRAVVEKEPERVDRIRHPSQGKVPMEIHYIVRRALCKDPGERHGTAAELRDEIQRFIDGSFPVLCPHTALKRLTAIAAHLVDNHARAIVYGALLLMGAVLLVFAYALG